MKTIVSNAMPAVALLLAAAAAHGAGSCQARAEGAAPQVVELYTSEGCDSCPRADRWLSTLKGRPGVLAAAFHVDYWDRLGWRDRFASAAATQRQSAQQASAGAGFSYTPQVLVDGRDWRGWPALPQPGAAAGPVRLELQRDGDRVQLRVQWRDATAPSARAPLAAWWALVEDEHLTQVKAGENAGASLHHDHVARQFGRLGPWAAGQDATAWLQAPRQGEGGRAARLIVVVVDAASGRTVQAAQLDC